MMSVPARLIRRLVPLLLAIMSLQFIGIATAQAATIDVCPRGCAFRQLGPAVSAAGDGDTIRIGPGTYAGGVTIDVSVKIVGAGRDTTVIRGGGPVLTIGTFGASTQPTVSIRGVTITGGVTRSSPVSTLFVDEEGVIALGGGVEIPPNADFTGGAKVTISDSAVTGNRVAPTHTLPIGPACPDGPCPFAQAGGGGIDSWGTLTLRRTTVHGNRVGSASKLSTLASDTLGGAITSWLDTLTIDDSVISDNVASATAPNGRFAEGGGVFVAGGTLKMTGSTVRGNRVVLSASLPDTVELATIGGGIHAPGASAATITNTSIAGNSVTMTNAVGDTNAFAAGFLVDLDGNLRMSNTVIADNHVRSETLPGSQGNASGDEGGGQLYGTVSDTRITGNTVTVTSAAGDATASAGAAVLAGAMRNSFVSGNRVRASSPRGSVSVMGAALLVDDQGLTLTNTAVRGNTADARGRRGFARGGGIYNGPTPYGIQGSPLVLRHSSVTGNALSGSSGITRHGGGVYNRNHPVRLTNSVIVNNVPDQCDGC